MGSERIKIPTKAWYGEEELAINFPDRWNVTECRMAGHDTPALSDDQIREQLQNTYGTEPLEKLAQGKKEVVILFDDLTRPAPTSRILPFVLRTLHETGIEEDHIRFVGAFANHVAMMQDDFVKKLGADVVRRYRVYNHNPYENLVHVSDTTAGTKLLVNREVMACDLRIGIGGLIPHIGAGFGGGAKLVFPGVMGIESVAHNHGKLRDKPTAKTGMLGIVDDNTMRGDIEEAVRMIGLDLKIDLLINPRREIIGVFAGDIIAQHRAGVEKAKKLYSTPTPENLDIVVTNAYPIENQATKAVWPARQCLKEGGTAVVITHTPEGQVSHYLTGRFGTNYGGRLWNPARAGVPNAKRVVLCSPCVARNDLDRFGEGAVACGTWEETMNEVAKDYPGEASVGVFPYASIQLPEAAAS
ncbi:MAG: hypothetical protein CME26_08735 [Gemmatimonadetes bacterium]|nr:hypothetical protein [Gemmatimonadota bacterium]|tara:strand:- start:1764 stop:3005 length:1242 start_codon:yes stop_codon:yes gene_type:complete